MVKSSLAPANSRSCTIHITDGVDSTRGGSARGLGGDAADEHDDRRLDGDAREVPRFGRLARKRVERRDEVFISSSGKP